MKNRNEQELRQEISYHWRKVKEVRATILTLYDNGVPLTSSEYTKLSRQVDQHGAELIALDQRLEYMILERL